MAKNENLHRAKTAKHDEFYTQRTDIENELRHYAAHFAGKVVYCNCDDPATSEFWRFFVRNFRPWGLKKLIATHYEPDERNYGYVLELSQDTNGDGLVDARDEPVQVPLPCNGDFRSAACIELLQQADIVVTNPPFSLFRDYVAQLVEYGKKFLIIGNQNAITYKEIFPLIKENRIWLGYGFPGNVGFFSAPYEDYAVSSQHKEGLIRVSGVMWFTNLDIPKRHNPLDLRGNYFDPEKYPHYDNYDAVEVSKVVDIPCDYDGIMGVPITFLDKYCPEQFEILGMCENMDLYGLKTRVYTSQECRNRYFELFGKKGTYDLNASGVVAGKKVYQRILIRRKKGDTQ